MDLFKTLSAIFGQPTRFAEGITAWNMPPPRARNPRSECEACGKVRVLGAFPHGGDSFKLCYNCANALKGHECKSGRLSRRKFYEHV